jgi:phenylacetate-CoA ligase
MRHLLFKLRENRDCLDTTFSPDTLKQRWDEAAWLQKFQPLWEEIRMKVPRWGRADIPPVLTSYADYTRVPFTTREELQGNLQDYLSTDRRTTLMVSTGGSTGRPLKFPLYRDEVEIGRSHQSFARRQYGIKPGDGCLIIWGQAAHLESSWQARADRMIRRCKDAVLGYHRISAYCLTTEVLRAEFDRMLKNRPAWIYGYSSSLLSFARANLDRRVEAGQLRLKAVIGAAESMSPVAASEVSSFFGCPVGMEYGSVEMRVCAHTHPHHPGYYVFSPHHLIEAIPTQQEGVYDLAVTKLFRAAMPLIRYLVGDQIVIRSDNFSGGPVTCFDAVLGRTNDKLRMRDGAEVHSETVTHAVRAEESVVAYQLHQFGKRFELHLVVRDGSLEPALCQRVCARLCRIHPDFQDLLFKQVADVNTTPAGKRRWVVRHD